MYYQPHQPEAGHTNWGVGQFASQDDCQGNGLPYAILPADNSNFQCTFAKNDMQKTGGQFQVSTYIRKNTKCNKQVDNLKNWQRLHIFWQGPCFENSSFISSWVRNLFCTSTGIRKITLILKLSYELFSARSSFHRTAKNFWCQKVTMSWHPTVPCVFFILLLPKVRSHLERILAELHNVAHFLGNLEPDRNSLEPARSARPQFD